MSVVSGAITLEGDDIGCFKISAGGIVEFMFAKIDRNLADVLEYASENGLTVSLELRPSYDDHVPQHAQDIPSPK